MSRPDPHAPFRELISRRLDGPLDESSEAVLRAHLAACPGCRATADAYAAQRRALRALPEPPLPRDLWARTSAALDREVARPDHRQARLALGTVATLGLIVAVTAGFLDRGVFGTPPTAGPQPTPYAITPQPVTFVALEHDQLVVYRAQVDESCPRPYWDCSDAGLRTRPVANVAAALTPSELAVGPHGQIVITGLDAEGHTVVSVVDLPEDSGSTLPPASGTGASGSPLSPGASTATPGASTASPVASSTAPPTATPLQSSGRPHASPAARSPGAGRTAAASPSPAASASPGTSAPGGSTSPGPAQTASPAPSPTGAATTVEARPILSDVIAVGAPAAWSPDGSMLAFSAMPADGSRGPDVYLWRPGQAAAHRLTRDHRSSFASWVGDRVLISRLTVDSPAATASPRGTHPTASAGSATAPVVVPATVLLDPTSGEGRAVDLPGAWLPSVDPTGTWVVYWTGSMTFDGAQPVPRKGTLHLIRWSGLDPFATTTAASPSATAVARSATRRSPSPTATRAAGTTSPSDPTASGSPSPTPYLTQGPLALDVEAGGVGDWLVRWSADGTAYGLWVADATAIDTGLLTVSHVPDGDTNGTTILAATPARRAFSLGADRVAWVEPAAGTAGGELQLVTWGPGGDGGLHIRALEGTAAVPAF